MFKILANAMDVIAFIMIISNLQWLQTSLENHYVTTTLCGGNNAKETILANASYFINTLSQKKQTVMLLT